MSQINDFLDGNTITDAAQAAQKPQSAIDSFLDATPKRTLLDAAKDTAIEVGGAAAGNVSAVANFVRPGNAVSQYIDKNIVEAGNAKQSDVVKAEKARYAQEMEQAQGFGDEVSATLGYVARNPLLAAAQAAGSFAGPGLAVGGARAAAGALGMVGKAATRTGLAAGAGFGTASAGGDAAGTAYELSRQGGATDEQALAAARGASVIPGAIGAAGGLVGAERLVAGAKGFTGGLAARALKTGAVEGAQEALEEGVTQYEGQRAAVPFNPELDPTKGVAGASTMGAVLGGTTGGGTSLLTGQNQPARKPSEDLGLNPDSGPISKVAAAAVDEGRAAAPIQPAQPAQPEDGLSLAPEEQAQPQGPTMEERLAALPEQTRAQADQLLREIADERVPVGVKRFRAHELQQVLDAYPVPEKTDTITPEDRAAMGPIVRGYDPATGEAPGRPLELEGERYQDGIDFTTDEQPSQSAYQDAINRIALESYQTPGQPLAMEQAGRLRDAAREQGIPATIVPHPSGRGFDVQATAVLPEDARQQVAQDPVAAALPYDNSPTGRMVADAQGNARPELRPEAVGREVGWNQELAQMEADVRQSEALGMSNLRERIEAFRQKQAEVASMARQANQPAQAGAASVANTAMQPKEGQILQNRDRSTPGSIEQMQRIAAAPDYGRLGFSRDFANGAPVVTDANIDSSQLGRADIAVASDGRRIPVQYAVVEADTVLPSNRVDGSPNAEYATAADRMRAIAGNGRIAGLQAAAQRGTNAQYVQELTNDTMHGINPQVIAAMRAPVLVRIMPQEQVTDDIGDVSNTTGNLQLSAVEQSRNDAQRVDLSVLEFAEDGGVTAKAVRQFVQAMPQAERGALLDVNGQPTKQAVDRLHAAVFSSAYGNDQLVRLYAQAQDPEARLILSALAKLAPKFARLEGAGALDIRPIVTQAAEIAVNARRNGTPLAQAAQQLDIAADPLVGVVLKLFAQNPRSNKLVIEKLGNAADMAYTEAFKPDADMFGPVPRATREQVMNQLEPQNEQPSTQNLEQPSGREPVPADVIGQPTAGAAQPGGAATEAGTAAAAGQQQDAETVAPTARQQTNSQQNESENVVGQAQEATKQSPTNLQEGIAASQDKAQQEHPAAGAANAEQTQQSQPNGLPQGARLETADRGMVQGMVRYVDGAGLPLSDWAEDEADALAQAIQQGRDAPAEKLLRDHFVAAVRADTAMRGNDVAQMLRMAQEREALVKQLVDAGYTQAEIGANSLGLPLEEFNRLVKEGIYSRERGAPDSLFPKRSTSRKAAAGPGKNSKPKQPPAKSQQAQDGNAAMFSRSGSPDAEVQRQFKETERAYGGKAAYDRAKAAGKTKLTHGQWVQVRTPNFKTWFGDWESDPENASKVVDSATGEPLVVYHGTNADFSVFRDGVAYFTPRTDYSYIRNSDNNMPVFLAIKNPYRPNSQSEIERIRSFPERVEELIAQGYDGMIWAQKDNIMRGASGWGNDLPQIVAFKPTQIKSATGNNGNFDPANQDIRRSFAGQQAATADTMALATAQQRLEAGEDSETVRQETGWHKGVDGKWRFEINDADARLKDRTQWTAKIDGINAKRDAALQALWQAEEQRNDFLRARGESPSRISSETKKTPEFKALAKALKNAEAAAEKAQDAAFLARQGDSLITVGDVLSHPALFAAYPGIADVRVDINDSLPAGNAAYTYELRAIELSGKSDAQQLLSTLLHEIQHGIQHIEGFAMGGNEDSRADVMQAVSQQRSLWADVYAVRRDLDAGKKLETVLAEWQDFLDSQPSAEALRIAQDPELETAVALQNMETLERQYAQLRNEGRGDTYRRLAGEVEARNTQARQGMNDAQRRATPPSQTADVADSDVIVTFNGKVAMSAPTPANAAPDAAPQPPRTPSATIRAAINRAYGKLLGQLEAKGLVTLAQTEAQAIEAAAQARAKKTGGDVAQIKRSLTAAMQGGTDLDVKRSANGAVQGFFDPQTGQSFLIADNLSAEAAPGVLMHEVGIHMAADGSMKALFNRAALMLKAQKADPFMRAVQAKLDAAGETSGEEAAAYIAEAYENDRANAPASVQRWLADLLAAVKAWMFKKGIMGADRLTVADIAAVARANARSMARDGGATGGQGFGTAFSRAPAGDQTQTEAFKRWFAGSRVVDAEGKPLVMYHGTLADFSEFDGKGLYFVTPSAEFSEKFTKSEDGGVAEGAKVMPVYVKASNPFDYENKKHVDIVSRRAYLQPHAVKEVRQGKWQRIEDRTIIAAIKKSGFDGIYVNEEGVKNLAVFDPSQIKSAIGNNGNFDPTNPDIRFSRSAASSLSEVAETGRDTAWTGPAASKWDDFIYKMQDKHIDTKRALEAVRETGKAVSDELDVYLQEGLYHGRAAKRIKDFVKQALEPLLQYMSSAGLKMADVEEYLHARHAKEANAVIAQRNPSLPDGGSGMTNAEADAVLGAYAPMRLKLLEKAAAKVDAIIAGTRNTFVEYGLESQDVVDGWAKSFAHYVPLMREQEGDGMAGLGTGQGFSIKGREVKGRTGSTRKVVDILANIAMQRERAIVRGEKNRVAAALVGLAKAHPSDFWKVDVVPTRQVLGKDGMVKTEHDPLYKQRDNVVVAKIPELDAKTGKVLVKEHAVLFNENDARALRMAQALKNLDAAQLEGMLGATAKVTRYLAAINTQYNPIFGITNFVRDVQGAAINLQSTALAGRQGEVLTQALPALRGIYSEMRSQRKGYTTGTQWSKLWQEFQEVGGQTGYRDQFRTSADRGQAIERALDPSSWAETNWGRFFTAGGRLKVPLEMVRKTMAPVLNWLDDYNTAIENGVRLAVYKAGLDAGMSKERAASIAKNLTTNFNRKGQVAQQVGALYAFFNASMQGTARIGEALFTMEPGQPKTLRLSALGRKVVSGGVLLGAGQALMLAAAGFGDDEPPEFVRERNLVIPLGGKRYATIPLPLGLHVLPNLGRIPTEFALGGFENPAAQVLKVAGLFADAFNPVGNSGLSMQTLVPTVLDPLAALAENQDFAGRAIAKESFNPITPGHALARDTATAHAKLIAEAVNFLSGGTAHVRGALSPTPDQIDYLIGQFTGGVGRELSKLQQSVVGAAQGDDVPWHKVPALGRFYGDANSPSAKQAAFYNHLDNIARHAEQVKGLRLEGEAQAANTYLQEHPEARLALAAKATSRAIQKMREQRRELEQQGAAREQVRQIEEQMAARMEQFNAQVERAMH